MPGAIAGTAILNTSGYTKELHTITLTINNSCNLNCPHCYLQYGSNQKYIGPKTIDAIFKASFKHLAIVGKEPLVNKPSILLLEELVRRAKLGNKSVSIITNGTALSKISADLVRDLDYIDISFDGGPLTYEKYRKNSFSQLIAGIEYLQKAGVKQINALHTLNDQTLDYIDDMLAVKYYGEFNKIMFSPYLVTQNFGKNAVSSPGLGTLLNGLKSSTEFLNTHAAFFLIDLQHLINDGYDISKVRKKIYSDFPLEKVRFIDSDPINYGIIRVTYDDLVLTPYESTDTLFYDGKSRPKASGSDLNEIFTQMVSNYC